jgi:hypothetical protein
MATIGTLGTDPDYASLYGARHDPRLLMAQKLMELDKAPTNNSTQSSFWANLLNQGARGALGGYLMNEVKGDAATEAAKQKTEAEDFFKRVGALPPLGAPSPKDGSGGTAPAAPAPGPRADAGGGGGGGDLAQAVLMNESGGRMTPGIYGDGGQAAGPMQVHPGALADVNRAQGTNYTHEQLAADPALGKKVGEAYLAQLRQQFGRDDYALGAYNAGPGTMRAAIANGAGIGGLPPATQQYVAKALSRMQGRQADASPAPGSAIDALMAGVNQPKPRGVQLAAMLGNTATDAPTPILPNMGDAQGTAVPRVPVSASNLPVSLGSPAPVPPLPPSDAVGVPGPGLMPPAPPNAAALPALSPADAAPPPAAAIPSPPPDLMPGAGPAPAIVSAPDAASSPPPDPANAVPTPAAVPPPDAASAGAPPTPALVPDNPMGNADPATLANFNGAPPAPTPAVVPPPDAAIVPPPAAAAVPPPAPAVVPPQYGPPRPAQLARRLVQPNDNASDALNAASLAAARAGQSFVPGAPSASGPAPGGPTDLFAQAGLQSPYAGPQGGGGGPSGTALAAPLVTPTSGPGDATGGPATDTSAVGGGNKGAVSPATSTTTSTQQPSTAGLQDRADQLAALAQEAAGSSNPRIRAYAGVLQAQSAALQHRIDRQDVLDQQLGARRDAQADRAADRNAAAADRRQQHEWDKQDKSTEAATAAQRTEDRELALKGKRWNADRTKLEDIEGWKDPNAPANFGSSEDARALSIYNELYPVMARGQPTDKQRSDYEAARTRLLTEKQQTDANGNITVTPGQLPNLGKVYGPIPGETPAPEQPLPPNARRVGSHSVAYTNPNQPVPEKVTSDMLGQVNGLRQVLAASDGLRKNPGAIGPISGSFPQVTNWFDPSGVPTRAMVQAIGSVQVHNISGSAVTAAEEPRLIPWIPSVKDTQAVALAKLERFATEYRNILADKYEVHGPDSNHQANPVVERALLGAPVNLDPENADAEFDKLKPGQVFRSPDGKVRKK